MPTSTEEKFRIEYLKTVGICNNGFSGRGFSNPVDIAINPDNRIFILNRCDPTRRTAIRIGICNIEEDYLGEFGYGYGDGDGQFVQPTCMAFDKQDFLHVTDEHNNRVSVFDSSGKYVSKWGIPGTGEGKINNPAGIAFDSQNFGYVVNQLENRIQKFTSTGEFVMGWGEEGSGTGQFNRPWGITTDENNNVYVADWRNDRVQKFSSEGLFLKSFGDTGESEGKFQRPSDVAVDKNGNIYVSDWGNERVQIITSTGDFHTTLLGSATPSKWANDFFESNQDELVERKKSNLKPNLPPHLNSPYHTSSQTESYFWGPIAVSLDSQERLYVVESNRHRFQVYSKV